MMRLGFTGLGIWLVAVAPATSQQAQPGGSGAMQMFRQAYEITKLPPTESRLAEAIDLCQQGLQKPLGKADEKYGTSLLAWSLNRRGEILAAAGKEEEALADFESALEIDPQRASAYHNRGVSLGMAGRYDEALSDFNRVLKLKPDHAKAYFNRGEIRFNQGDLVGAMDDYNQSLRYAAGDPATLNSRGFVYYSQGNYPAAIRDYTQAISGNAAYAEAYTNRGDAQADLGQFAQALRDYQSALRVNPKYGRAHQSMAWLRATCPDPSIYNPDLAVRAARQAVQLDGEEDFRYLDTLAAAQASAADFDAAKESIAKALALAESGRAEPDTIRQMQLRQKQYEAGQSYRRPATNPRPVSRRR